MDIKDLNKNQLILLTLLLSFVTSIATGIATVTLLQEAPESVTVPINRVVRQTVEKIQQVEGKTTVQTIVVKEEDLVVDAIAKNQGALFAITIESQDENGQAVETSVGRGFVISDDGTMVADGALVRSSGVYYASNSNGKFKAEFISKNDAGFSFLKIGASVNPQKNIIFTKPVFGDLSKMKAGQKVIVFGGVISSFIFDGNKNIKINVPKENAGGVVLNLDGEALGIALSGEGSSFVSIDTIIGALKQKIIPTTQ